MLRIVAYSEPWYIQNSGIFRSRAIFSTVVCFGALSDNFLNLKEKKPPIAMYTDF